MRIRLCAIVVAVLALGGCSTVYYGAMEKLGVHKREILADRVQAARDTQDGAKKQFLSALEQFKSVVSFSGGDLEAAYSRLNATLKKSEAESAAVRDRIRAVEDVSEALFAEWREEITQYSSDSLRRASQRKYDATKAKCVELIRAMRKAEARLEPVLVPLRDQVLFLKHNLNAKAIAGLHAELGGVEASVDSLVRDMDAAIAQADTFIAALRQE